MNKRTIGHLWGDPFKKVRYGRTEDAYDNFPRLIKHIIATFDCKHVLDVGGGAQPQLTESEIVSNGIDYTVMDISRTELDRAPSSYKKVVMDISAEIKTPEEKYDLVFSRFVAEHVTDAWRLHSNVHELLNTGGIAVHFFPTLYAIPFLVNKMLPEFLTVKLLSRERQARGKFAAYYNWCVGPSNSAVRRLENLGYEVLEYAGFFGHGYYDNIRPLRLLHDCLRSILLRWPVPHLTSFACVILKKADLRSNPKQLHFH